MKSDAQRMPDGTPPVVTLVKGGLGNQLFCYAAGRALAARLGRPLLLDAMTGFRRDGYGRAFRLDRFPLAAGLADETLALGGDVRSLRHKLARRWSRWVGSHRRTYWTEAQAGGPEGFARLSPPLKPVYLNGYWQDEAYFAAVAAELRAELAPPAPVSAAALEAKARIQAAAEPVLVHVRRERYQPRLAEDYYRAAIAGCLARVPGASFFIFGDDAAWSRANLDFQGAPHEFLDDRVPDEIETLHLMAGCRHAITANSSFSWWGAWLGEKNDSLVWTPEHAGFPVKAPDRWLRVPNRLES